MKNNKSGFGLLAAPANELVAGPWPAPMLILRSKNMGDAGPLTP